MNREDGHLRSYESFGWDDLHVRAEVDGIRHEDLRVNMCGSDLAFAQGMDEAADSD